MPETQQPPQLQHVNLMDQPFFWTGSAIGDNEAITIVKDTLHRFESWRKNNVEPMWLLADELYNGVVEIKHWHGTKVERSHLSNAIAFDHVESQLPVIESAIFDNPEWFSVEACEYTDPKEARQARAVLEHYLQLPMDEEFTDAECEIVLAIKDALMYGNGALFLEWNDRQPTVRWLDLANVYIDPGCVTPNIESGSEAVIVKDELTIQQLRNMREQKLKDVHIPNDLVLNYLANLRSMDSAEALKQLQAIMHGEDITPGITGQTTVPAYQKIPLHRYYSRDRVIWTLGGEVIIHASNNPYNFFPVVMFPCRTITRRCYGTGLPYAIRDAQKYSEAILNSGIDEFHAALYGERYGEQGTKPSDLQFFPGKTSIVSDVKKILIERPKGQIINAFPWLERSEQQAERRNGVSGLQNGALRPGAARTKAGVDAQVSGPNNRLYHLIHNLERWGLKPMLYKIARMIRYHTMPEDILTGAYGPKEQRRYEPVRAEVFHREMRFKMACASKMLTRDRTLQTGQLVGQMLIQGPVIAGLAEQNLKFNFEDFARMIQDGTGSHARYDLIVPMTEQEIQQRQAIPPQVQAEMQQKQQSDQLRLAIVDRKGQYDLQKEQIKKQPNPLEQQMKQQETASKIQADQVKMQLEAARDQQKISAEQQKSEMEMQYKERELQLKERSAQQQMVADARKSMMDMQVQERQGQMDMRQQEVSNYLQNRAAVQQQQIQKRKAEQPAAAKK